MTGYLVFLGDPQGTVDLFLTMGMTEWLLRVNDEIGLVTTAVT
jgi:hypothetical protein